MEIDKNKLKNFVKEQVPSCRVLVVGDVMLDKYYYGEVSRISPEAPVPVNKVISIKETMGGAANVAHNLALMGANVSIAGFVGDDYHCTSLLEKFVCCGINYDGIVYRDKPTTAKLRIIGGHQQMLRLDFEDTEPVDTVYAQKIVDKVKQKAAMGIDGIILSDYGKGACTEELCSGVISLCNKENIPVFIDPKGNEWEKYSSADYITPNLKEINEILTKKIKNIDSPIEEAANYIIEKYGIKNVLATRSECGLSFINKEKKVHIPTKAQEVFDVSGAGDTVLAIFALGIVGGLEYAEAAYLANLAASVVVAKVGTYAISNIEMQQALKNI